MDTINHLLRGLAPITPRVWQVIEDEARNRLIPLLAARQVVSFAGPGGWEQDAVPTGKATELNTYPDKLTPSGTNVKALRVVQPLTQVRIPFTLPLKAIEEIERGSINPDLTQLDKAAKLAADFENYAVFNGWDRAFIAGIVNQASPSGVTLPVATDTYPADIAKVVDKLRTSGVVGPYTLAIGTTGYQRIIADAGSCCYVLSERLTEILGGKIVLMPCLDEKTGKDTQAVVLSERGGDFLLIVGQDLSIGYLPTTSNTDVSLYLEETFTFRVARPSAALTVTVVAAPV
ncbi:family 1 encapsulin nanocompartment shell protein [Streptomyces halobius]|uniref:Type 1 encapsulin shell protein n=1 Tax=Streptomyces halobius TaxID=2879846 RepID=A0ABY4MH95_9ACTN|nr:family 1 encapsulin nanocompartment shell protein [Streptomyces halobius]UQA97103.1 bacteriocin family protein [Streptomyces halobius]